MAPMICLRHEVHAGTLAPKSDQAGGPVGGRDPEDDEGRRHCAEQAGFPPQLSGVPDRALGHIASTAVRNRRPRSS